MLQKCKVSAGFAVILALSGWTFPAAAEITRSADSSFVSRHEVVVKASPKDVWLALISPAGWWRSEHTWSGDAKNLTLMPQAGGCFCETIPEVDEPGRFTLQGSVEHMRVVQAYPEAALRMTGSLGPLQSEPVTGVLTITISSIAQGTRIVWEYNVGGPMRYEIAVISQSIDGVMGTQLAALAKPLEVVVVPALSPEQASPPTGPAVPSPQSPAGASATSVPAAKSTEAPAPKSTPPPPASVAKPAPGPKPSTVDDAFSDLEKSPPG